MIQFSRADIVKNYKNISSIGCAVEIETNRKLTNTYFSPVAFSSQVQQERQSSLNLMDFGIPQVRKAKNTRAEKFKSICNQV